MRNIREKIKEFYLGRAKLYAKIKQYKKAVNDYEKVYSDYVSNDIVSVCESNGFTKEAEKLYTKAINEDKNNPKNYLRRAYFYMLTERNKKALSDCEFCLKLYPKDIIILTLKDVLTKKLKFTKKTPTAKNKKGISPSH